VQTGFGSFVTVYLVKNHWPPEAIGFALDRHVEQPVQPDPRWGGA
jgi:hypothetical protein